MTATFAVILAAIMTAKSAMDLSSLILSIHTVTEPDSHSQSASQSLSQTDSQTSTGAGTGTEIWERAYHAVASI